jgi:hypothetical protein
MRYHWGLGVGHMYAHGQASTANFPRLPEEGLIDGDRDVTTDTDNQDASGQPGPDQRGVNEQSDTDSSYCDSESEDTGDDESDWEDYDGHSSEFSDDDEELGYDEMYGDDADL